jgi:hypothetical protein
MNFLNDKYLIYLNKLHIIGNYEHILFILLIIIKCTIKLGRTTNTEIYYICI